MFLPPFGPWMPFGGQRPGTGVQPVGPAFALVVPFQHVVETHPPDSGLHPHAQGMHAVVDSATTVILLFVVVLVAIAGRVTAWVVDADGKRVL
jgi:hypothetical protein